jgi:alpha-1,3-glucan synthase
LELGGGEGATVHPCRAAYARVSTPHTPSKLVLWFLVAEFFKTFFLSGQYGRNWRFLWSQPLGLPITLTLIGVFWIGLWAVGVWVMYRASRVHSWVLPVFAAGLLAPRWAQILWSVSDVGTSLAWANGASAGLALSLWLVLGVLDGFQVLGLVTMLMQTLTRIHLVAVMSMAQGLGVVAFMLVKWTGVDQWAFVNPAMADAPLPVVFWGAFVVQIVLALGCFVWFRREQLSC